MREEPTGLLKGLAESSGVDVSDRFSLARLAERQRESSEEQFQRLQDGLRLAKMAGKLVALSGGHDKTRSAGGSGWAATSLRS